MRRALVLWLLASAGCAEDPNAPEVRQCPPLLPLVDFGEVDSSVGAQRTIELIKPNQRTPVVVTLTSPPPPFFLEPTTMKLMPGARMPVRVTFAASDPRQHFGTLTYRRGAGCEPQEVQLTGVGSGALFAEESRLDFGPVPLNVTSLRVLHLRNTRRKDVVVELQPSLNRIYLSRKVTVPARSSLDVEVKVLPRAGEMLRETILVFADAEGPGGLDTFLVHVTATAGRAVISVDRTEFVVERVPLDGWLMRRFWITNTGDGPSLLRLEATREPDGGTPNILSGASISSLGPLPPDSGVAAWLHLRAERAGSGRGRAVLETDDPTRPTITLTVEGTGMAVGACGPSGVVVSPARVEWQPPMFPAQQTFTFTNPHGEDCLLDSIEASDPQWRLAAGEADQALVPAGGSVTRTLDLAGPGDGFFMWNTYLPPFIQNGQVELSIRP